jgi:hypothetical protein
VVCARIVNANVVISDNAANAVNAIRPERSSQPLNLLPIIKSRNDKTNREWTPSNAKEPNRRWTRIYSNIGGRDARKKALRVAEHYEQVSQRKLPVRTVRETLVELFREAYGESVPRATVREFIAAWLKNKAPEVAPATLDLPILSWDNIDLPRNEIRLKAHKTGKRLSLPIAAPLKAHLAVCDKSGAYLHPNAAATVRSQKRSVRILLRPFTPEFPLHCG